MISHPILFSGPMFRAILDGRKTQTRRVVVGAPVHVTPFIGSDDKPTHEFGLHFTHDRVINKHVRCPYGAPGDQLWCRETWKTHETAEGWDGVLYKATTGAFQRIEDTREASEAWIAQDRAKSAGRNRWRPSIHMPRWASRLTLEVTGVRVERLVEISEADAMAEGIHRRPQNGNRGQPMFGFPDVYGPSVNGPHQHMRAAYAFEELWESVYGAGSWAVNPWVFVVTFRRIDP